MGTGKKSHPKRTPEVTPESEHLVGVSVAELAAIYALDRVKGFGPQKYKQLAEGGIDFTSVLDDPASLPIKGKRGETFREQLREITPAVRSECRELANRQIATAHRLGARILTYRSPGYPRNLYVSNNPSPVLYVRGAEEVLASECTVGCVGSRAIRPPYTNLQATFARVAASRGVAVVSGFALGGDSVAHAAARKAGGYTICCMPSGLDRPFPPENREIWDEFLTYEGAVFVSDFSFGTGASSVTLRKRNKLIVAFSRGVVVGQSAKKGGAMNAYRLAREQKKPVATFKADGHDDTSGNALIVDERNEGDAVFSVNPESEGYVAWLRKLCSSM